MWGRMCDYPIRRNFSLPPTLKSLLGTLTQADAFVQSPTFRHCLSASRDKLNLIDLHKNLHPPEQRSFVTWLCCHLKKRDDYPDPVLLLREGMSLLWERLEQTLTALQVTGDLWERYLKLIEDEKVTDGYVVLRSRHSRHLSLTSCKAMRWTSWAARDTAVAV